jgi:hydroxyacyl-ACP dehydratase HTD2-like protein with hotdog domain
MINTNKIYQWSRTNLFSNWYNSLLSLIIIFAFIKFIPPLLNWLFFDATFKGSSKGLVGYSLRYGLKNLSTVYIQRIKFGE